MLLYTAWAVLTCKNFSIKSLNVSLQLLGKHASSKDYSVDFEVIANDRPGLLKDILAALDSMNKTALKVNADVRDDRNSAHILFRVDVSSQQEINHIKEMVACVPDITGVSYKEK